MKFTLVSFAAFIASSQAQDVTTTTTTLAPPVIEPFSAIGNLSPLPACGAVAACGVSLNFISPFSVTKFHDIEICVFSAAKTADCSTDSKRSVSATMTVESRAVENLFENQPYAPKIVGDKEFQCYTVELCKILGTSKTPLADQFNKNIVFTFDMKNFKGVAASEGTDPSVSFTPIARASYVVVQESTPAEGYTLSTGFKNPLSVVRKATVCNDMDCSIAVKAGDITFSSSEGQTIQVGASELSCEDAAITDYTQMKLFTVSSADCSVGVTTRVASLQSSCDVATVVIKDTEKGDAGSALKFAPFAFFLALFL